MPRSTPNSKRPTGPIPKLRSSTPRQPSAKSSDITRSFARSVRRIRDRLRWRHIAYPIAGLFALLWLEQQFGLYKAGRATCYSPAAFTSAYCDPSLDDCVSMSTIMRVDGGRFVQIAENCNWVRDDPATRVQKWTGGLWHAATGWYEPLPVYWDTEVRSVTPEPLQVAETDQTIGNPDP